MMLRESAVKKILSKFTKAIGLLKAIFIESWPLLACILFSDRFIENFSGTVSRLLNLMNSNVSNEFPILSLAENFTFKLSAAPIKLNTLIFAWSSAKLDIIFVESESKE